jgi:hypothetical protein
MEHKCPIQPNETVAVIKIGEREPVLEDEVGHRDRSLNWVDWLSIKKSRPGGRHASLTFRRH